MIIKDYQCVNCKKISEHYVDGKDIPAFVFCPNCETVANKIISISQTTPIDSEWIHSVLEVVEKDSNKPHCNEFLKNPTRANYKNWMAKEKIRHLEPGEKLRKPKQQDITPEQLMKYRQEKRSLTI